MKAHENTFQRRFFKQWNRHSSSLMRRNGSSWLPFRSSGGGKIALETLDTCLVRCFVICFIGWNFFVSCLILLSSLVLVA